MNQQIQYQAPARCECHECTQARWKMSFQGQLHGSLSGQETLITERMQSGPGKIAAVQQQAAADQMKARFQGEY